MWQLPPRSVKAFRCCPSPATLLRADRHHVRVEIHENLLRDEHGKVIGIHSVLLDITQRHLVEAQITRRHETE